MRKSPVRATIVVLAALVLGVVFWGCGGGEPTTVSQQITAQDGATVSLGDDITLRIPAGALPEDAAVTITRATEEEPAPGDLEGAKPVGAAFNIDLGGQELSEPVTLEIAFDPELLPDDSSEEVVFLAFYDDAKKAWVPVGGKVDEERNVVIIETDHLSWWDPFSWNWDAWIAVLKKILSLKLSDWIEGAGLLTGECKESGKHVNVNAAKANNVIQGCVTKDDPSKPEFRVVNLKSFYLGISPAPGGPGYPKATILGPGDAASFTASTSDTPPATVYADFTEEAMWRFVTGLAFRMLPGGEDIPGAGLAFMSEGLQKVSSASDLAEALDRGDGRAAAEALYDLMVSDTFITTFVKLASQYGSEHGIDMMTKWTQAGIQKTFLAVAAVDVTISATDFIANYFFNNRSEVAFNWTQPTPTPTPTPTPPPRDPQADLRQVALDFLYAWKSMDYHKMAQLVDPAVDSIGLLTGWENAECVEFGPFTIYDCLPIGEWASKPYDDRCLKLSGAILTSLPCATYELTGVVDAWVDCRAATPAESANGYGLTCVFGLAFGQRMNNEGSYEDASMCIQVQERASSGPVVVRALPITGTLTESGCDLYVIWR